MNDAQLVSAIEKLIDPSDIKNITTIANIKKSMVARAVRVIKKEFLRESVFEYIKNKPIINVNV